MDHREQNSSCPVTWDEEPRGFLTEWEATPLKPKEDAMQNDEAERPAYLICKYGGYYRPNCCGYTTSAIQAGRYTMAEAEKFTHPNGPDGPRDGMHYVHEDEVNCDDLKAYRVQSARIAELETKLQAVLRREADANRAAFAHMRRITALEANGIAARKATAKNYARAEAAEAALAEAEARGRAALVNLGSCATCGADLSVLRVSACCNNPWPTFQTLTPADAAAAIDQKKAEAEARGYARGLEDANRSHLKTGGECECGLSGPCMQENCRSPILRALAKKEAGE